MACSSSVTTFNPDEMGRSQIAPGGNMGTLPAYQMCIPAAFHYSSKKLHQVSVNVSPEQTSKRDLEMAYVNFLDGNRTAFAGVTNIKECSTPNLGLFLLCLTLTSREKIIPRRGLRCQGPDIQSIGSGFKSRHRPSQDFPGEPGRVHFPESQFLCPQSGTGVCSPLLNHCASRGFGFCI